MTAHVLHFSRADLLDMEFFELVEVWYPQATEIFAQTQKQSVENLARILHVGFKGG